VASTLEAMCRGEGRPEDIGLLEEHCDRLGPGHTFCALAPGAAEPLMSALKHYREDFEEHIQKPGCPYK
jgi:NADH-quinone oxidoreductase subunit F